MVKVSRGVRGGPDAASLSPDASGVWFHASDVQDAEDGPTQRPQCQILSCLPSVSDAVRRFWRKAQVLLIWHCVPRPLSPMTQSPLPLIPDLSLGYSITSDRFPHFGCGEQCIRGSSMARLYNVQECSHISHLSVTSTDAAVIPAALFSEPDISATRCRTGRSETPFTKDRRGGGEVVRFWTRQTQRWGVREQLLAAIKVSRGTGVIE